MNPDDIERQQRPYEDGQSVPDSGMPQMLGIGLVFAVIVAGLVFYNATSDHGATSANTPAPQHANAPPGAAPAPPTKTQ
jgi:UDP-N-acetylmuramyl pentapeptide phosphotransferase/UDP-N-acetylglucosamine-1-phosphate transferase